MHVHYERRLTPFLRLHCDEKGRGGIACILSHHQDFADLFCYSPHRLGVRKYVKAYAHEAGPWQTVEVSAGFQHT